MEVKKEIQENIDKNLKQLLKNSKFFNTGFYKKQNPKLRNTNYSEDEIIANYLINNKDEKFPPSKFFDIKWYVKHNPDVEKTGMDQLIHFIKFGQQEGRLYRYTPVDFKGLNLFDKRNNLYEIYRTIYHSDIFDIDYYLNNNGDFDLEGYDPIIHYILIGAERGYNPSRKFNTKMHMQNHDLNKIITNPLYHYIKYGKDNVSDEEFIKTYTNQFNNYNKFQVETVDNILSHLKEKVSIIIPIYNAYEETRDCIRSVLLNTRIDYELILINDCSPDKRIRPLLDSLEGIDNIRVIHNKENQGFIKNVNMGMTLAGNNDVVLLNSDTIVTPRWLTKILISAYKDPRVATVTPLANASDISAVNLGIDKDQLLINKNAYKLEKLDYDSYFEAPTGNGFCLFIKREALNELGLFDIKYILGYGEETDFTARAFESGWKNLRVFDTFIYHREHASFTKERTNKFKKENKLRFMEKYPDVYGRWNNFIKQPKVNEILRKTKGIQYLSTSERILYVTQIDKKGNPEITDKFYEIAKKYDTHILAINDTEIFLYVYDGISKFRKIYSKKLVDKTDDEIRTFYFNMFTSLRYNLLYVRQIGYFGHFLYNKIPSFIKLTKPLEIPVIYEGNNYYSDLMNEINRKLHPIKSYDETINNTHNRISFKDKKMVVYTAITGGFDDLVTPSVINEDFDYVCFTDNPELKSDFWDIRLITGKENELDNIRKARRFKMFPHIYLSEYDYSLWIDGNFDIIADVEDYIKEYSKNNKLLAIPHDARDCIYEEAHATIEANKDYPDIVELEMDKYEKEGFPHNYGLIASGIIFRDHHDPEVIKLMEDWFSEVMNYSQRCQLSFNYVCWKNNFQYDKSDLYCFKNQYFIRTNHADNFENFKHIKYQRSTKDQILTNLEKTTTIIIPIYNRYDDTVECIKSIIKYTHIPYEIVVIDDNSTDKRINPMLMEFSEKYDNIHLLSNTKKEGFGKCVNIGLNFSDNDVVILKSNTILTPHWLEKIKSKAYMDDKIATVTPLSNSIREVSDSTKKESSIGDNLELNDVANIIEKLSMEPINTPVADDFCMFIKRCVINEIGIFDLGFKHEYGAEKDFSIRATTQGWNNIIDTTTYIYHNKNVSKIDDDIDDNEYLKLKYPEIKNKIIEFNNSSEYKNLQICINRSLNDKHIIENNRKNILYVIDEEKGSQFKLTLDQSIKLSNKYDSYILILSEEFLKLYKINPNKLTKDNVEFNKGIVFINKWKLTASPMNKESLIGELEQIYFNILKQLNIDVVHIQHIPNNSFNIQKVAHKMGLDVEE